MSKAVMFLKRKLMRVPLDFDWPQNLPWKGYARGWNRVETKCSACNGNGYSHYSQSILNLMGSEYISVPEINRIVRHPHIVHPDALINVFKNKLPELAEAIRKFQERLKTKGNASFEIISNVCIEWNTTAELMIEAHRLMDLGNPFCEKCGGSGKVLEDNTSYSNEQYPPPGGVGYQLWEFTSEGSPISPVFETIGELSSFFDEKGVPEMVDFLKQFH